MTLLSDIEPINQAVSAGAVFGYVVVGLIYWIATIWLAAGILRGQDG